MNSSNITAPRLRQYHLRWFNLLCGLALLASLLPQVSRAIRAKQLDPLDPATASAATTFTVTNTNDAGPGSLRQAITDANANPGLDTISFNIGSGPQTIKPLQRLPTLTDAVVIDGTTQPGFSGAPVVEINGALQPDGSGLFITGGNSTVRGLVLNGFVFNGILMNVNGGNRVEGCYIGTDITGTVARFNGTSGIEIRTSNNFIGGTTPANRNVISGNNEEGIDIQRPCCTGDSSPITGNVIQGNYIGVNAAGNAAIANRRQGVSIGNSSVPLTGNVVGGTQPGYGNVISGNRFEGLYLFGFNVTGNTVQGNFIGTDATGSFAIPNDGDGLSVTGGGNLIGGPASGARNVISGNGRNGSGDSGGNGVNLGTGSGNILQGNVIGANAALSAPIPNFLHGVAVSGTNSTVGGVAEGEGNVIAFNGLDGIFDGTPSSASNSFRGNSIFSNGYLGYPNGVSIGIDLGGSGVTPNDPGDGDTGANNLQNFPVITSVNVSPNSVNVKGTLNSTANQTFTLDFYANSVCDALGFGEGARRMGSASVTTDAGGDGNFDITFALSLPANQVLTATATDAAGNTSEFSQCFPGSPAVGSVAFSNTFVDVVEGFDSEALFVVNRTGGTAGSLTVGYVVTGETATAGSDFTPTQGTLTFADGETSRSFTVPILDDNVNDLLAETAHVSLTTLGDLDTLGSRSFATLTIEDDDPRPSLSISDVSVNEGSSGTTNATFTVSLSAASAQTVTVQYMTVPGTATAGNDYQTASGTVTFNPGDTSKPVTVVVNGDVLNEPSETFFVNLSSANNATIADAQGQGTIIDAALTTTVNTLGDAADTSVGDGHCDTDGNLGNGDQCTLRAAIQETNVIATDDVILFAPSLNGSTITLASVLPDISGNLNITGPAASLLTVQRSTAGGTPDFRIFKINSGKTVTIARLTISNGSAVGTFPANLGGDLFSDQGTLVIDNCVIKDAVAGGGIGNFSGSLIINDSIISGNSGNGIINAVPSNSGTASPATVRINNSAISGNSGSGIFNSVVVGNAASPATVTINNSTISGNNMNDAGSAAGIRNGVGSGGTATITINNSTISGNTNSAGGTGAIYNAAVFAGPVNTTATVTVTNSTIFGNTAGSGAGSAGGISNLLNSCSGCDNTVRLRNTIVAGNFRDSGATASDISGAVDPASSFNLIGTGGSGGLTNGVNNNQVGIADPHLGPLGNSGGPTQTHALFAGSPALDAASDANLPSDTFDLDGDGNTTEPIPFDQRGAGFTRVVDGPDADTTDTVDIGAFEAQVSVADIADQTINEDGSLSLPFNVGGAASITSMTATSSDITLVPNNPANISISGSGSTRTLQVNPVANAFGTATITVTVNGSNGQTMTDTFLLTVNSVNDVPSFLKGSDQTVNENDGAQTVSNWAGNISAGPANESGQLVDFVIVGNSNASLFAVAPVVSPSGTLTYTPATGVSGTALITLALMDNGGTTNGGVNTSATQTFNINVREGGTLQFSSATFSRAEDGGNAVITVNRTGGTAGEALVNYATSNGTATAGQDYTAASGTLIFPDGITSKSFNVAITNDVVDEPDETITLTLTSPAGSGSLGVPASALLTITDNDPAPGISINDVSTTEGDSGTVNAIFTVTLSGQSSQTVTVNFATADGTATADNDYQANSGTVTFLPLETAKPITVTVNGDINFEPNETFFVNLSAPVNATISDSQGGGTITNDDAQGGFISFSQANYTVGESGGFTTITVRRTNDLSGPATVDYATSDDSGSTTVVPCSTANGIASSRCDFTTALGTLRFAVGENSKTFVVLISQDNYVEGSESLTLTLSNLTGGAAFATPSAATLTITDDATEPATNPIDTADAFVHQHYHDFLNREADAAGLAFWTNQITECQQPGSTCSAEVRRINVSAAFFLSIEFQETGYLVERLYKVAYSSAIGNSSFGGLHVISVPIVRFKEFLTDTQQIGQGVVVGQAGWEHALENNKLAFALDFVSRARFTNAYATTLTPAEFVDALFVNAGVTPSATDRDAAINEFGGAGNTADTAARARVVRRVAENSTLKQLETNSAFVLMQYIGYLRRNPNDAPDSDYTGYDFWLTKLNQFNGNFVNAEMVKAFIVSGEYRQRFGP